MELKGEGEYRIRFRHMLADIGPYVFTKDTTILQVKERLLREWPRDGQQAMEIPSSSRELLLILGGKPVEETKALFDYEREMGNLGTESILTMHLVIRQQLPSKSNKKDPYTGCCCSRCIVQ